MSRGATQEKFIVSGFTLPQNEKIPPAEKKKKIIVLAGPTAVGKSQISLVIAKAIGGEIISADSMQVYRGMDIGTAKVSPQEQREIQHHLIDTRDLDESFNVFEFYTEAHAAIHEILDHGAVPIIVGGSGFYIHALIYGPPLAPPAELELRKSLEHELQTKGIEALYTRLQEIDPEYAKKITRNDRHKIVRALEIHTLTGKPMSHFVIKLPEHKERYDFRCWFLYYPKEILYPRIEERCDRMIAQGFVDEVKKLEQQGLGVNPITSQAIGYRQCLEYLQSVQGPEDWDRFVKQFKQASRRYAKRQFTWFRKEPLFRWLDLSQTMMDTAIELIIQDYEISW